MNKNGGKHMKIKIGPVEVEQDPIKDEVLYDKYKKDPKEVQKYLVEKSKYLDLSLKQLLAGKTMKMLRDSALAIAVGIFFIGWSLYIFYVSKDSFAWDELTLESTLIFILQAFLILGICFLPVGLVTGFFKFLSRRSAHKDNE